MTENAQKEKVSRKEIVKLTAKISNTIGKAFKGKQVYEHDIDRVLLALVVIRGSKDLNNKLYK